MSCQLLYFVQFSFLTSNHFMTSSIVVVTLLFVCLGLTSLLNIWGHIAKVPACSSFTLTNVLPHRNVMPQTQDMTPHPVTVYDTRLTCRCAIHWCGTSHWNTQLPILMSWVWGFWVYLVTKCKFSHKKPSDLVVNFFLFYMFVGALCRFQTSEVIMLWCLLVVVILWPLCCHTGIPWHPTPSQQKTWHTIPSQYTDTWLICCHVVLSVDCNVTLGATTDPFNVFGLFEQTKKSFPNLQHMKR